RNQTSEIMKKTILSFGFIFLLITLSSCKDSTKVQSTDSQTGVETQLHEEEEEAIEEENRMADFFAENEGKYPRKDLDIFENEELTNRIKKLVGEDFAEVYENF